MGDETIRSKADEWKGEVKETVGDATDDDDLQAEGAMDQAKARAKETVENAKEDLEDAGRAAKDKLRSAFDR